MGVQAAVRRNPQQRSGAAQGESAVPGAFDDGPVAAVVRVQQRAAQRHGQRLHGLGLQRLRAVRVENALNQRQVVCAAAAKHLPVAVLLDQRIGGVQPLRELTKIGVVRSG